MINKTDGVAGGQACIRSTRIPVWLLVLSCKKYGIPEDGILNSYPSLTKEDLQAAWDYYDTHKDEIDPLIVGEEFDGW